MRPSKTEPPFSLSELSAATGLVSAGSLTTGSIFAFGASFLAKGFLALFVIKLCAARLGASSL